MEVGDTTKTVDQGVTAGSRTIERAGPQLRQAAAATRQQLLKMASAKLEVPIEQLTVTDGVVSVMGNGKKVSYGSLVGGKPFNVQIPATGMGWDLKVAPDAHVKSPKDYKIVGTSVPRVDLPTKFTASFVYTQDVRVPGMLHGRVVRPATVNSKPASVDEDSDKGYSRHRENCARRKLRRRGGADGMGGDPGRESSQGHVDDSGDKTSRQFRSGLRLSFEDEELRATPGGESRKPGRGDLASRQELRSDLPLALPDARHDGAFLRRGRRAGK